MEAQENISSADGAGGKVAGDTDCEDSFWCPKKEASARQLAPVRLAKTFGSIIFEAIFVSFAIFGWLVQ